MFLFSRAVAFTALTSPVSYHVEGSWFQRGRTHNDLHSEICARAMLGARWRLWAATQVACACAALREYMRLRRTPWTPCARL
eukprot:1271452-Prymnesium_polylepis.2